ncbi:hypothetical protein QBC39DRAFT_334168 [Podospora conica]|nr:hypothetical protein QBC39DRAFT_334168 [Schizothecium conicum]
MATTTATVLPSSGPRPSIIIDRGLPPISPADATRLLPMAIREDKFTLAYALLHMGADVNGRKSDKDDYAPALGLAPRQGFSFKKDDVDHIKDDPDDEPLLCAVLQRSDLRG